jgi:hypothetical protein
MSRLSFNQGNLSFETDHPPLPSAHAYERGLTV